MKKTLIKTLSYKAIATVELALIAWLVTGDVHAASHVGGAHLLFSTLTYFGFDHAFEFFWK